MPNPGTVKSQSLPTVVDQPPGELTVTFMFVIRTGLPPVSLKISWAVTRYLDGMPAGSTTATNGSVPAVTTTFIAGLIGSLGPVA